MQRWINLGAIVLMAILIDEGPAQNAPVNYDEAKVPQYTLPDPLVANDGTTVKSAEEWKNKRRAEVLRLFEDHVYGRVPPKPEGASIESKHTEPAFGGLATRKNLIYKLGHEPDAPKMQITLFVPANAPKPVPAFVGVLLFDRDEKEPNPGRVVEKSDDFKYEGEIAPMPDDLPGERTMQAILERGYAIASLDPDDFAPDNKDTYDQGIIDYYRKLGKTTKGAPEEWGAIGAWAWCLSRALDYFETDPDIDAKRVVVVGHSRRGKTALWAGAQDERFAIVISNNSGCGGAALSRRAYGETVKAINERFPHWFCDRFNDYNANEAACPVDQHELIALAAPRPVYVASAIEDRWADPHGEFLAAKAAEPVYALFGLKGLGTEELPPLNKRVGGSIGYHVREGKHALADFDWMMYLDFADRWLKPTE